MASALAKQVAAANQRAKSMGMAGTLTTLDWRRALEAFGGRCAYCGEEGAVTIDHFIPLATWGGATTQSNCVPSCPMCNHVNVPPHRMRRLLRRCRRGPRPDQKVFSSQVQNDPCRCRIPVQFTPTCAGVPPFL
jgi:5-methylcytosine-specific restriction endonuclease McrA